MTNSYILKLLSVVTLSWLCFLIAGYMITGMVALKILTECSLLIAGSFGFSEIIASFLVY
jgi:hypothetical protein